VAVSAVVVPVLVLGSAADFVPGTVDTVTSATVILVAEASLDSGQSASFSFVWSAGAGSASLDQSLLDAFAGSPVLALEPTQLASGSSFAVCVTASTTFPVVSLGVACTHFSTAVKPALGAASVTLIDAASATYIVGVSTASAGVSSLLFVYMSAARSAAAMASLNVSTPALAAAAIASAEGPFSSGLSLFDKRDSSQTAVTTSLLPSGAIAVCIFGLASSGGFASSCVGVSVPAVTIADSAAASLLTSTAASGDTSSTLAAVNYVALSRSGGGGRQLAASSSVVDALLGGLASALASSSADDVPGVISSLRGIAPDIASSSQGRRDNCSSLALGALSSLTMSRSALASSTLGGIASTLDLCEHSGGGGGAGVRAAIAGLLESMSSSSSASTFSVALASASGGEMAGASGLTRAALNLASANAVVTTADASSLTATSAYPAAIAAAGGGISLPRRTALAFVTNLSNPIEVQVKGIPLRAAGDRTFLVKIAFANVNVAPSSVVAGVFTDATGAASHAGVAVSCNPSSSSCTLVSTHNSTFTLTQEPGTAIIVSTAAGASAATAATAAVAEGATVAIFVRLQSQPDADVVVAASVPTGICYSTSANSADADPSASDARRLACSVSADCGASHDCRAQLATVSPASLTFTASNWATPQHVTVAGTSDHVFEENALVVGRLSLVPSSSDTRFDSLGVCMDASCSSRAANAGAAVDVTVSDADAPGVVLGALSASTISEAATSAISYTLALASRPASAVTIAIASSMPSSLTASPASVTVAPADWATPVAIVLSPIDNFYVDGIRSVAVSHTTASSDSFFNALAVAVKTVSVTDNDVAGVVLGAFSPPFIYASASDGLSVGAMLVTLTAMPSSAVTVTLQPACASANPFSLTASGPGVAGSSPPLVVIEPSSWATGTVVTWSADASSTSGNAVIGIIASCASSDAAFEGLSPLLASAAFTILDASAAAIVPALAVAPPTVTEGTNATFTITLQRTLSSATLMLALSVASRPAFGAFAAPPFAVLPASLVFAQGEEQIAQSVTLVGPQGDVAVPAGLSWVVSVAPVHLAGADPLYTALAPLAIAVLWASNVVPSVSISPPTLDLSASPTGQLSVAVGSSPAAGSQVVVSLSASAAGVSLSATALTFSDSNWRVAQPITVTVTAGVIYGSSLTITASCGGGGSGDYSTFVVSPAYASVILPLPSPSPSPSATASSSTSPTATPVSATPSSSSSTSHSPTGSHSRSSSNSGSVSSSPSPSPSMAPVVKLTFSLSGVSASAVGTAAVRTTISASIASAAGLAASAVVIQRITDISGASPVVVFQAASFAGAGFAARRQLQAGGGTLRVEATITTPSVSTAATVGGAILADTAGFGGRVAASLRTADPATFAGGAVIVAQGGVVAPLVPSAAPAAGAGGGAAALSGGAIAGIVVLAIVLVAALVITRSRRMRARAIGDVHRITAVAATGGASQASAQASPSVSSASGQRLARGSIEGASTRAGASAKSGSGGAANPSHKTTLSREERGAERDELDAGDRAGDRAPLATFEPTAVRKGGAKLPAAS
jgi:hypothetical protein